MRRNIGNALALYSMPVTVVGAMNGDEPTYSYLRTGDVIGPCADYARAARA